MAKYKISYKVSLEVETRSEDYDNETDIEAIRDIEIDNAPEVLESALRDGEAELDIKVEKVEE